MRAASESSWTMALGATVEVRSTCRTHWSAQGGVLECMLVASNDVCSRKAPALMSPVE